MSPEAHRRAQALLTELRWWVDDMAAVEAVVEVFLGAAWADSPGWAEVNAFNLSEAACDAASRKAKGD